MTCTECGHEITAPKRRKTCSKACYHARRRRQMRERYQRRVAAGLCPSCGGEHSGKWVNCDDCRRSIRQEQNARRQRLEERVEELEGRVSELERGMS